MRFRDRYNRLTLWNKISFWGALSSFVGLAVALWVITWPDDRADVNARLLSGIDDITGGESFAYVVPQPHDNEGNVPLAIRSVGQNPLSGVKLTIHDISSGASLDQAFTEVDLRRMLEHAKGYRADIEEGRWVIDVRHKRAAWEVIVEPDIRTQLLVVVTASPVEEPKS